MDKLVEFLYTLPQAVVVILLVVSVLVVLCLIMLLLHAYWTGRKLTLWGIVIERGNKHLNRDSRSNKQYHFQARKRISLFCSTTYEIEKSKEKQEGLRRFYVALLNQLDRTPYGINSCGAEPFRSVVHQDYCYKLARLSKAQINQIHDKIRWYWYPDDNIGWGIEPPIYNSVKAKDAEYRTIRDVADSDAVIAFTGRMGAREQLERVFKYHATFKHGINLNHKLMVFLCWFGGSIEEFVKEHESDIHWMSAKYLDLQPFIRLDDWEQGEIPEQLALKLVNKVSKLLS